MKIGFVVGRLERGGAEIQLMHLASGLAARGNVVEVLSYGGSSVLDRSLEATGVTLRATDGESRFGKLRAARLWMSAFRPDVVHGIMKRASSVAVLGSLGLPGVGVVATDMSTATFRPNAPSLRLALVLYGMADRVVTQTELNRKSLDALAPWLRRKTTVIRNGVDTTRFSPIPEAPRPERPFTFCVIGTVYAVKNPMGVVKAVEELLRRGVRNFRVDWYGRLGLDPAREEERDQNEAVRLAADLNVESHIRFHGQTGEVESVLRCSDALLHASVQEGFPNAVVEGMACGLPIVVSRVSDLPLVVDEARNGFVFDERNPSAIADAMESMIAVDEDERREMGARSRELAVRWFGLDRFVDDFEALYHQIGTRAA